MKTTNSGNYPVAHHLEEADLISHLDGELTRVEQDYARTHLESCWSCRSRLLGVQKSIERFLRVRKQVIPEEIPPADPTISQFRRRLTQHSSIRSPLRQQLTTWWGSFWCELRPFNLVMKYNKATLGMALASLVLLFTLVDPLNWNKVSADELLMRADAYESLYEQPAGRVIRARVSTNRVALTTGVESRIGEIETIQDNHTSAVYVSEQYASGASRQELIRERDKVANENHFAAALTPETAHYLVIEGWYPQVSVSSYRRLIAGRSLTGGAGSYAVHRGDTYELHHRFAQAHPSRITEAVLVLNAKDYAPQSISIVTSEKNERFEYQIKRLVFEAAERTPEIAGLFEVSSSEEKVAVTPEAVHESIKNKEDPRPKGVALATIPLAASAQLEVEVLGMLSQIDADLGQEVVVTRVPNGALRVEAVVSTDQRKQEILAALTSVAHNPALTIEIETSLEAGRRSLSAPAGQLPGSTEITSESVASNAIAVQTEVRQYLQGRGVNPQLVDAEVGRVANRIVTRSHRSMLHVWALKSLVQRFSGADLKTLDPEARAKWLQMISAHARRFQNEAEVLHKEIALILNMQSADSVSGPEITDDAHLLQAVTQLIETASFNHEVIRSAFTISAGRSSTSAITTPQFWRSMSAAEATAGSIKSANQKLK